jgi:hypothetical protein
MRLRKFGGAASRRSGPGLGVDLGRKVVGFVDLFDLARRVRE